MTLVRPLPFNLLATETLLRTCMLVFWFMMGIAI